MAHLPAGVSLREDVQVADATERTYGFSFTVDTAASVRVERLVAGSDPVQVDDTDYEVQLNPGGVGGRVVFGQSVVLTVGQDYRIYRDSTAERVSDFTQPGFAEASSVEAMAARLVAVIQELTARQETHADIFIGTDDLRPFVLNTGPAISLADLGQELQTRIRDAAVFDGVDFDTNGNILRLTTEDGRVHDVDLSSLAEHAATDHYDDADADARVRALVSARAFEGDATPWPVDKTGTDSGDARDFLAGDGAYKRVSYADLDDRPDARFEQLEEFDDAFTTSRVLATNAEVSLQTLNAWVEVAGVSIPQDVTALAEIEVTVVDVGEAPVGTTAVLLETLSATTRLGVAGQPVGTTGVEFVQDAPGNNRYWIALTNTGQFLFAADEAGNYRIDARLLDADATNRLRLAPPGTTNVDLAVNADGQLQATGSASDNPPEATKAEAEAGTEQAIRSWSPQRVRESGDQAVLDAIPQARRIPPFAAGDANEVLSVSADGQSVVFRPESASVPVGQNEEILLEHDFNPGLDITNTNRELPAAQAFSRALSADEDGRILLITLAVHESATETATADFPTTTELAIRVGDWRRRAGQNPNILAFGTFRWVINTSRTTGSGGIGRLFIDKSTNGRLILRSELGNAYITYVRVRLAAGIKGDRGDDATGVASGLALPIGPHLGDRFRLLAEEDIPRDRSARFNEAASTAIQTRWDFPDPPTNGPQYIVGFSLGHSVIALRNTVYVVGAGTWSAPADLQIVFYRSGTPRRVFQVSDTPRSAGFRHWYRIEGMTYADVSGTETQFTYFMNFETGTPPVPFYPSLAVPPGDYTFAGGSRGFDGWVTTPGAGDVITVSPERILVDQDYNPPIAFGGSNAYEVPAAQWTEPDFRSDEDGGVMLVALTQGTTANDADGLMKPEMSIRIGEWRQRAPQRLNQGASAFHWSWPTDRVVAPGNITWVYMDKGPNGRPMFRSGIGAGRLQFLRIRVASGIAGPRGDTGPAGPRGEQGAYRFMSEADYQAIDDKATSGLIFTR